MTDKFLNFHTVLVPRVEITEFYSHLFQKVHEIDVFNKEITKVLISRPGYSERCKTDVGTVSLFLTAESSNFCCSMVIGMVKLGNDHMSPRPPEVPQLGDHICPPEQLYEANYYLCNYFR